MRSARKMWQKRKILCFLLVVCLFIACYRAESSTSYFGKQEEEDVCVGDECSKHESEQEQIMEGNSDRAVDKMGGDRDDVEAREQLESHNETVYGSRQFEHPDEINVIITFTNAKTNTKLQKKFELTLSSMLQHTSASLALHIIGDPDSQQIAEEMLNRIQSDGQTGGKKHRVCSICLL